MPACPAITGERVVVDPIKRQIADERFDIHQDRLVSIDRFLLRVFIQILLNRIPKGTFWPFAVDPNLAKFAQAMSEVSLGFLAVGSARAFTQSPVSPDTFVDVPDVASVFASPLQ
jgi:hypothetical protein